MRVQISYFSGTGCTEYVAKTFTSEFTARGHAATCKNLAKDASIDENIDLLVVCFVVHACNAPEPVMKWARGLDKTCTAPVAVISVSGGGEVTPNLACRVPIKRTLRRRNFRVAYEKMLVMPSNWIVETKRALSSGLLRALPRKVSRIVNDLLQGTERIDHPPLGNRFLTFLGTLEHRGAHFFGKGIRVDPRCDGCGLCVSGCPVANIALRGDAPAFDGKCALCLNCIYSCPHKALRPTVMKFVTVPNGFSFKDILAEPRVDGDIDLDAEARGFLWLGVKRYLANASDTLEPAWKGESG